MILGITGGSGCGKTTLLNCVLEKDGLVLDCDAIYHSLLETDIEMLDAIAARFPQAFSDGKLQRKVLGSIVFSDEKALSELNAITHAAVKKCVQSSLETAPALAAIDAYALFESGLDELCDVTVAVTAPLEDRVSRLMTRDGISQAYARLRIDAQHSNEWFSQRCSVTLTNDSDRISFLKKCVDFLEKLDIISIGECSK